MTTEQMIQNVKYAGQSLIDDAKSIVGDYKYQTDLSIMIQIPINRDAPIISVTSDFIPEGFVCKENGISVIKTDGSCSE